MLAGHASTYLKKTLALLGFSGQVVEKLKAKVKEASVLHKTRMMTEFNQLMNETTICSCCVVGIVGVTSKEQRNKKKNKTKKKLKRRHPVRRREEEDESHARTYRNRRNKTKK